MSPVRHCDCGGISLGGPAGKYQRNDGALFIQLALQLETGNSGHVHIQQDTARLVGIELEKKRSHAVARAHLQASSLQPLHVQVAH